jgi:serpin B
MTNYAPKIAAAAVILLVGLGAYALMNRADAPPPPLNLKTGQDDPALVKHLVAANTAFGFRLFARLSADGDGENVFFSPYSVASALTMTWNGASGVTTRAMAKAMGLDGMSLADVDRAHAQLTTSLLRPDKDIHLSIANSLWGAKEVTFRPEFLQDNRDYFGAEVATLDYTRSEGAADRINGWVRKQTQGKIDHLVQAGNLTPDTVLMLVNAVYFQGDWQLPFDSDATADRPFTLADSTTRNIPMMRRAEPEEYGYLRGAGFQAVRLPYRSGSGKSLAMYVFLPDDAGGLAAWLRSMTPERWDAWIGKMQPRQGSVVMPKFKAEYEAELSQPLSDLGMGEMFRQGRAEFGRMTASGSVYIKRVDHKAILEIDESGTVAAAATSVQAMEASAPEYADAFTMVVDHPFFCAIRDDATGEVLFMGAIWRP